MTPKIVDIIGLESSLSDIAVVVDWVSKKKNSDRFSIAKDCLSRYRLRWITGPSDRQLIRTYRSAGNRLTIRPIDFVELNLKNFP